MFILLPEVSFLLLLNLLSLLFLSRRLLLFLLPFKGYDLEHDLFEYLVAFARAEGLLQMLVVNLALFDVVKLPCWLQGRVL